VSSSAPVVPIGALALSFDVSMASTDARDRSINTEVSYS